MKKISPQTSFILPTRNRAQFVNAALTQAKEFMGIHDELIVVDGSNTDDTQKIVKKFKNVVTQYIRTTDIGEGHKMNVGILASTGRIIKPISDDDIVFPQKLKKAISLFDKLSDVDVLFCGGEAYFHEPKTNKERWLFNEKVPKGVKLQNNFYAMLQYVPCHLGLMFKRRILPIVGLYDTSFTATDTNLMARLTKSGCNIRYFDGLTYRHIQYDHSTELRSLEMNRDRARSWLLLPNWNGALTTDTKAVANALGLSEKSAIDRGYVWALKLLNYTRQVFPLSLVFVICGMIGDILRSTILIATPPKKTTQSPIKWSERIW